jgi:hypothetical protein
MARGNVAGGPDPLDIEEPGSSRCPDHVGGPTSPEGLLKGSLRAFR